MDIELLRTFLELNRTRHFGRTADALAITQAAVSSRLKSLERILGVTLFDRSTREMRLTPEGGRLVRHSEKIIASWRAARQDVSHAEVSEQLVIGASLRLWDVLLRPWIHELRRRNPDMAIIAEAQSTEILTRRLVDGTLDVAVVLEPAQQDVLQIEEVATLELILVSSERSLAVDEALDGNYVFVDWGLSFGLDHRRTFPDAPEAPTRVSQGNMALDYLLEIGGSAYLPRVMVGAALRSGALHIVQGAPAFSRCAYAIYPVRSPRLDLLTESLRLFQLELTG